MKTVPLAVLSLLASCSHANSSVVLDIPPMRLAGYSYTTGCYHAAIILCHEVNRDSCLKQAMDECPKLGDAFDDFIYNGDKK